LRFATAGPRAPVITGEHTMKGITRALSEYICASRYEALPAEVRHEGVRAFLNFVGCAVGGAREEIVDCALPLLQEFNGKADTTLLGRPEKLDALNAALVNSMTSSALSYNDTHYATVAHPSSPVGAALAALAERRPVSGKEFVHGMALGIEMQCRAGLMLTSPPAQCAVGLSMAGLVGAIGAAVATGKAMGFDEKTMALAIGHAANHASGLREAHATMGSHYTPGNSARCGLLAAFLAERGFTCTETVLEGVKGFAVSYSQQPQPQAALAGLGSRFEVLSLAYKPYPSGFVVHPVIDVCLDIARNHSIDPAAIERVELTVNPLAVQLCNRPSPGNRPQALVSLQHWTAVCLMYKAAGVAQVASAVIHDPAVAALRRKVIPPAHPAVAREATRVPVVLGGGKTVEASVEHCRGSDGHPLTDEEMTVKTRDLLRMAWPAERTEAILAECWGIEKLAAAGTLCAKLGA